MNLSPPRPSTEQFLAQRSGAETLASSRALTFGGAGASLALILLIAQIGVGKPAVLWSLGFAALAFPFWLALALTYDLWLAVGLDLHDLLSLKWLHKAQAACLYGAGFNTFLSVALLLFSLHTTAGVIFIAASLGGLGFVVAALIAAARRLLHHMARSSQALGGTNDAR